MGKVEEVGAGRDWREGEGGRLALEGFLDFEAAFDLDLDVDFNAEEDPFFCFFEGARFNSSSEF